MSHLINVSVKNHVAKQTDKTVYVCGNGDFVINFDFDSEWNQYNAKTARFTYAGTYVDVVFTGNTCAVPVITDVWRFKVGVFAGDLSTTTPVLISASKSILCDAGAPAAPTDDVYNQIMEVVNEATTASNEAKASAEAVTPDDTAIDGKPWTSKKIVNTLCPAISETGNPVQCYPLKGYPLTATASWEPTQSGSGNPSPDNIRPITGRNSVQIQRCGENLININKSVGWATLFNQPKIAVGENSFIFSAHATFTITEIVKEGLPKAEARISLTGKSHTGTRFYYVIWSKKVTSYAIGDVITASASNVKVPSYLNAETIDGIYFYCLGLDGTGVIAKSHVDATVVFGTTAPTEHVPYTGTTTTLTLPETIYGGTVGNDGAGKKEWALINSYNGEALPSEWISDRDVYTAGGTPTTGAQVAYKLATPTTFTATGGAELTGLDGLNNVLTDADSVTVEGREDIKHTIAELQDALASATEA